MEKPPKFTIKCSECGIELPENYWYWNCRNCGAPLEIKIEKPNVTRRELSIREGSIWRYKEFIPLNEKSKVTLGEGFTPMIKRKIANINVLLKLEFLNPTGSFKDRGASTAITRAISLKAKRVVEDSSGNAGASIAAYATAAGIQAKIYIPKSAPKAKKEIIMIYGGQLTEAKSRSEAAERAVKELNEGDYYIGHAWNPFFIEGVKTMAYELAEQLKWNPPDNIIVPTGNGTLLLGLYKGFNELINIGWIKHRPKLIAVQPVGCAPLYEAIYGKSAGKRKAVLADAMRVANPPRIKQMIEAIRNTEGKVILVDDAEIVCGLKHLLKLGLLVEPTSASAVSALIKLKNEGTIEGETCIPLTGCGVKMASKILRIVQKLDKC
ncbi:MAG: threonine synthase [archaeon GB-1867-005]|nr:threonine synthase [Candidatus Culexmicrobium cathedralense]